MPEQKMTRCETKRLYKIDGAKQWRWVDVAVADLPPEPESPIRCAHCHGAVKIHKTKTGVQEHVKHKARVDADNCQGGNGAVLSSKPIE
ncbi:MAG TPA: hypothetical protein VEQ85_08885 [Lacipirellulaceae bacterium]|nr:hypothetical protein [Lacipirellulaceae bacterium]